MVTFDFTGKVALVTGGGSGIGAGLAKALANANAQVVIGGRRLEALQKVAAEMPDNITPMQLDITNEEHRARVIADIQARHGQLDCLINNAGLGCVKPFKELSVDQIDNTVSVNLGATAAMSLACLPELIRSSGNIINVSSVGARVVRFPPTNHSIYAAAKAGVNQLTRAMAVELAPDGVRVNAIAPGATASEIADASNPAMVKFVEAGTPMGRFGQPEDIAPLALFLASSSAHWITGQVIDAAGGWGLCG